MPDIERKQTLEEKVETLKVFINQDLPGIIESGEDLTEDKKDQLFNYCQYLLEWNEKINLISRKSEVKVIKEGLIESLSLMEVMGESSGKVLDIGSGGGFPGIVLAIMNDELCLTLLDSVKKKTMVLKDLVDKLGLKNVSVMNDRMEDLKKKQKRNFDFVVTRGVGKFPIYIPIYLNFVDDFGSVFILTGEDYHSEKVFYDADILKNPYFPDRVIAVFSK